MPHKEGAKLAAEVAGDLMGLAGTALVGISWMSYLESTIGIVGGIMGLVAMFFSVRLNIARYKNLEGKDDGKGKRRNTE